HFTGKDASRAWVSECWGSEDQLTWRMDGIEAMFMPKYLDEQMQQAADGESDIEGADAFGGADLLKMAKQVVSKYGRVSKKAIDARRVTDREEAEQSAQAALAHWIKFFSDNSKYNVVGNVILDDSKPEPPVLCEAALRKRPVRGGKLDALMQAGMGMGGGGAGGGKKPAAGMPDFVKNAGQKAANVLGGNKDSEQDDVGRDEL
ncbi:hypothetical protein LTR86_003843, partial [Recurvomyces mirabilis]